MKASQAERTALCKGFAVGGTRARRRNWKRPRRMNKVRGSGIQDRAMDVGRSYETGWDLGPFAAGLAPGQTSPRLTKYKETVRN